ncbi:MAG: hypothetical protein ACBR50_00325 [Microcoleus sp.]
MDSEQPQGWASRKAVAHLSGTFSNKLRPITQAIATQRHLRSPPTPQFLGN